MDQRSEREPRFLGPVVISYTDREITEDASGIAFGIEQGDRTSARVFNSYVQVYGGLYVDVTALAQLWRIVRAQAPDEVGCRHYADERDGRVVSLVPNALGGSTLKFSNDP